MAQHSTKNNFLKGAAMLAAAGLLVRLIGAFYRIPLAYFIGGEGVGIYTQAYPFYNYLLIFSTSGIPSAIAKMVSEAMVLGEYKTIRKIFRISMTLLFFVGLVSSVALFCLSGPIAGVIRDPLVKESLMALSPALFFVALISVYRGYFQGLQNMAPTALSQVLEQLVKLVLGLYLAKVFGRHGVQYGAAGALVGVSISEVLALLMLMGAYFLRGRKLPRERPESRHVMPTRTIVGRLLKLAVPIMLAASVMALAMMIDSLTLQNRLQQSGVSADTGRGMIGLLGMVNNIVNVTSVLSLALSMSLVPAVARSQRQGNAAGIAQKSGLGIKISISLVMPAAAGLMVLAHPILSLIYGRTIAADEMGMSVQLMTIAAGGALFLSMVQTTNGILQGLGAVNVPLVSLCIGAMIKVILNYTLVSHPAIGIYGASIGTVACYLVAALLNTRAVCRITGLRFGWGDMFFKPLGATLGMSAVAYLVYQGAALALPGKIAVVLAIVLAIPAYVITLVALGGMGDDELRYIPGGNKLLALFRRMRLL
ncbi:MAG: polysaccharide biosynthesis protein [Eubacteriales bacterium]|nr:polysaccharide biosynthesis protein [Eubacteriales bacterium]